MDSQHTLRVWYSVEILLSTLVKTPMYRNRESLPLEVQVAFANEPSIQALYLMVFNKAWEGHMHLSHKKRSKVAQSLAWRAAAHAKYRGTIAA